MKMDRMAAKISQIIEVKGVEVDSNTHSDLVQIMKENSAKSDNSFQNLFWEQQKKATLLKNARNMKWHPLMIKWCLYLRHISGKAYDTLR